MISAIEIVKDKNSNQKFHWKERIGFKVYQESLKNGVLLRPLGDTIYFMPPYIIDDNDIELMTYVAKHSINKILNIER